MHNPGPHSRPFRLRILTAACLAALSTAAMAPAAQAAPAAFTLQQVLSAPFPSGLTTATASGQAAWVSNKDGARNVWVASPGGSGYAAHAVTAYTADDGTDMGELSIDARGRLVAFTRGGSLEGGGPVNIMSAPDGPPPQEVFIAPTSGGAPRKLGPGHGAVISPDGAQVAFVADGRVFLSATAADAAPASQLIVDRGQASSLAWSRDGARLAFVSTRGDHSIVGVYDIAAKTVSWPAPSVDADQSPQWSPDGRRLAFIRLAAGTDHVFLAHRQDQPWSIWVADVATGLARAVWTSTPGPGSVFQSLQSDSNLLWTADDRLVFPWEKSGWQNLYAVPAAGGEARALTPGAFEVFDAAISSDRKRVVYSSNQGDIDHRHISEVTLAGGATRRLTTGATIEDYPRIAGDGGVFALHGDGRNAMRPVSLDSQSRMRDLAPGEIPASFPASKLVEPQQVVFTAADGLQVHGQLFLPPAGKASRGPAVLFFHGGPIRQMLLGWHPMDAYSFMYGMNQYLASEGYVVLSVNYRGGVGYGLNFREAPNFGAGGASELNDILGAALYLRGRPDVDAKHIGIWGGSYGGLMTALGLSRASDLLAAGVDYAGVHDWRALLPPTMPAATAQLAYDSSAMATIDNWRSPVLVVHADDDRNVPFSQTVELVQGLRKHGVEVEQVVIPDEVHDLLRHKSWLTLFDATDEYFGRKLMGQGAQAAERR